MPPLKGVDRGLNGRALKALEESGHGRRLAVVDASYNIPRWAEVVDYLGKSSAAALLGIVKLVPIQDRVIDVMVPDQPGLENPKNSEILPDAEESEGEAREAFEQALDTLTDDSEVDAVGYYYRLTSDQAEGFYEVANDPEQDTLFVRTIDRLPYACATFIIGHSQIPETTQEEMECEAKSLGYASFDEFREFSDAHPELGSYRVPGGLWGMLMRVTGADDRDNEKRGTIEIGNQELELFKLDSFAGRNYSGLMRQRAIGYYMNLDTLEHLVKSGNLLGIYMLGPNHQRLSSEFIEARRAKPEEQTDI